MPNLMIPLFLIISLLAGGCATIKNYPERTVNLPEDVKVLNDKLSLDGFLQLTDEPAKKSYRNNFINAKILAIDQSFETFQEDLVRESDLKDLGADWANLALTGATAVVPLAQTKTVLSAIATGITGAKGSVDTNLFFKKTVVALITQMKADRKTILLNISNKMDLDTGKYPLTAALIDLEGYYNAGTLPQSITSITATAGATIKDKTEQLQGKFVKDIAGNTLISLSEKYGKPFDDKLQQWIIDHNVNDQGVQPHVFSFIRSDKFSQQRQQVIPDLPNLLPGGN